MNRLATSDPASGDGGADVVNGLTLAAALAKWASARQAIKPWVDQRTQVMLAERAALRVMNLPGGRLVVAGDSSEGALVAVGPADWDTETLKLRVGRCSGVHGWSNDRGGPQVSTWTSLAQRLSSAMRETQVELLIVRLDASDPLALVAFQRAGFLVCDALVTLDVDLRQQRRQLASASLEQAGPADGETITRIAATFRSDHFHADPRIRPALADRVYQRWAREALAGRADVVLVARKGGDASLPGFVTCLIDTELVQVSGERQGVIDLIAVDPPARGRGVAGQLVSGALDWFAAVGCTRVRVGTQLGNGPAVRSYLSAGFTPAHFAWTLHGWRDDLRAAPLDTPDVPGARDGDGASGLAEHDSVGEPDPIP